MRQSKRLLFLLLVLCFSVHGTAQTNEGTEFWIAFPPNASVSGTTLKIFISSEYSASGSIYSAFPGIDQNFTVVPGIVTSVTIPTNASLTNGLENKGIKITTDNPVSVYGLNTQTGTSDAFLALPITALGNEYRLISYPVGLSGYSTSFSIVATVNSTHISIHNHMSGVTSNIIMNMGETFIDALPSLYEDMTGSTITSDYPIAVFGSNKCAWVPIPIKCECCDHLVEMMLPVNSWGKDFVTVAFAGRDSSGDLFRILASEDGTQININGILVSTIDNEEFYETNLAGYNSITTSKPALVTQFAKGMDCTGSTIGDPFMMQITPYQQFLTHYTVGTVSGFTSHWTNIVASENARNDIYKDGVVIPVSSFTQIAGTTFYGAQIPIAEGSHTFTSSAPFGVYIYGWGFYDSYGYAGGCSMSPVATVKNVFITPDTAYGTLNVTNMCFNATVTDIMNNPVPNILVDFHIDGINPVTGNGYTDLNGQTSFCYTQSGSIPGTDSVYAVAASISSSISRAIWDNIPCTNPSVGGTIGDAQNHCGSLTPNALVNLTSPSGHQGTLEYLWQSSTISSSSGFNDIPGSDADSYSPGLITQTTWFRRLARVICKSGWVGAAVSNVVEITVNPILFAGVSISPSSNPYCEGSQVTITATPSNEGANPVYEWKLNGAAAGTNSAVFIFTPSSGDNIQCFMTSDLICVTGNPTPSLNIILQPDTTHPAGITISTPVNPYCEGSPVTITATPSNGGTTPVYQWKRNGINAGTNSPVFTFTPADQDSIRCIMTSNLACVSKSPVSSSSIILHPDLTHPAGISISSSANPFCSGKTITITAIPVNGGLNPLYQWKVNGLPTGPNAASYSFNPSANDVVQCHFTSNLYCVSGNPIASSSILLTEIPSPIVAFPACFDEVTTFNAKPIKLKGGTPYGGTYSGPGVNPSTSLFTPSLAGTGLKTITYTYTNAGLCSDAKTRIVEVRVPTAFTCGNPFTDIRDNKTYKTIQIGAQCWFAEDLNYGTEIPSNQHQRDNCVSEKYCHVVTSLRRYAYQWDELMQYTETPGEKGLCPPSWHVPTEAEWQTLFSNWTNAAFAGAPLKFTGFSGFNALLSGASFQNQNWNYPDFATFLWTSSPHGAYKTWAHGMNSKNYSVSAYPSSRANAYSVRCIRD